MATQLRSKDDADRGERKKRTSAQGEQYLTFNVSDEVFAINISMIREIIEYRAPTTVPMMPVHIRGVINLRGRVVPVIDLSARFGRDVTAASRRTCIVILEITQDDALYYLGIVVDAVKSVQEISHEDIEPAPTFGANLRSDFIKGMGKINDNFVIILDVDHVLSIDELSMLSDMGEADESHPSKYAGASKEYVSESKNKSSDISIDMELLADNNNEKDEQTGNEKQGPEENGGES